MSKVLLMIKEYGFNQKFLFWIKTFVLIVLVAAFIASMVSISYSDDVGKGLADNLIRLHVLANSDSPEDQELKRDVRDIVLGYMKEQLKDSADIEQTKFIINKNIKDIEKLAAEEIGRRDKGYAVKAILGDYPFPTKMYGDITLPAGNYQALRVVIGKGEGANWWCVLFPPLCFVDATHGTVSDSVKEDLRRVLTEEEYSIITSSDNDQDIPVRVKFKVVEFFQDSRIRFTGVLNKLFK